LITWTSREIKARYKQTVFGIAWAVFQPLVLTIIFALIFSVFIKLPSEGVPYPLFVYSALLPWTFFSRAAVGAITSIVGNMNLVKKIYFPREILVYSSVAAYLVDFLCGLLVYVGLMIYYRTPVNPAMLMLPVLFTIQIFLTLGVALGAAALNVYLRDINQMAPLVMQMWMYASPVIYSVTLVPEKWLPFYLLNPMAVLVASYRAIILQGVWPDLRWVAVATLISGLIFLAGYGIFKRLEGRFADII
jgi:lipopolysaccharide transport system permease protein